MKADLSPKLVYNIHKTIILWFHESNKYVVISERLHKLLDLFLNVENKATFLNTLNDTLDLDPPNSEALFNEISSFLEDANTSTALSSRSNIPLDIPAIDMIKKSYRINNITITVHFESPIIESLIHPQIAQYQIENTTDYEVLFEVFKTNNELHLFKDRTHIGSYNTNLFHFLQGKFALELTNAIHNTNIENWIATFHASTVSNGQEAIMIIGDSGNGKSTLSALLMAHGLDVLADDFTPLHENLNLYRYPAAISVKKGAFDILKSEIPNFESLKTYTSGPKKVNLKYIPTDSVGDISKTNVPCKKIVFVKYDKTQSSELKAVSVEKILETLIPESWISPTEKHAILFLDWLKTVDCYMLNYSNNDFAITNFKALFDA